MKKIDKDMLFISLLSKQKLSRLARNPSEAQIRIHCTNATHMRAWEQFPLKAKAAPSIVYSFKLRLISTLRVSKKWIAHTRER
jgi:hypothetical protein